MDCECGTFDHEKGVMLRFTGEGAEGLRTRRSVTKEVRTEVFHSVKMMLRKPHKEVAERIGVVLVRRS